MALETNQARKRLKTPRAAAIAGIVFSLLLMASLAIIRLSLPADPSDPGEWIANPDLAYRILIALNMVPFSGIAFLWFIGVIRDLIGEREDKFFATVFLGSGLLFVAMLFAAAAVAGGLLANLSFGPGGQPITATNTFNFGRAVTYSVLNVFAMKMAGVFMISTCTMVLRTESIPKWLGILGYVFAAVLILSITYVEWIAMLFPLWVLMLSVQILVENYRRKSQA
ncbi:MAG TPA: hypothetical protein VLB04_00100 [Methanotrichaceae archaeon]|nr:hypothetical protein [Methanotrichaceae archaeon]